MEQLILDNVDGDYDYIEYSDDEEEQKQPVTVGGKKKSTKNRSTKKIQIDISLASTAQALMKDLIKQNSSIWHETFNKKTADVNYVWCNAEDDVLIDILSMKGKVINRYPGIKGLSHKDSFSRQMKICLDLNPEAYDFVPPSFEYPSEKERLVTYMKANKGCCYIAKPQAGAQGDCIIIFRSLNELDLKLSCKSNAEYVVQRYIDKPLLVKGFKHDLRIYVAVTGIGGDPSNPMQAFVCDEGLARFCTEKYAAPTKDNFKNEFMHLTNYSINKASDNYIWEPEDILRPNDGSKRTLTALYAQFEEAGIDVNKIKDNINYSCQGIMQMFGNLIQHQTLSSMGNKKPLGKVFQIFGFDILLDEDLKAWILEINDHPSLNIFYQKEFMGKKAGDEIISYVDLHVKSTAMKDALDLVLLPKSQRLQINDRFESYSRIMPCSDQDHAQIGSIVYSVRQLFYKLCSIRDKMSLSSSQFEKLHTFSVIKKSGIARVNLSLLFQKCANCQKTIDLMRFIDLINSLHSVLKDKDEVDVGEDLDEFVKILLEN